MIWKRRVDDYPGATMTAAPTLAHRHLDRGFVYVTTGDSYSDPAAGTSDAFIAFDIKTGKLLWSRQTTAGDAFNIACGLPEALRANCPEAKGPDVDFGSSAMLVDLPDKRRALIAGQTSNSIAACGDVAVKSAPPWLQSIDALARAVCTSSAPYCWSHRLPRRNG